MRIPQLSKKTKRRLTFAILLFSLTALYNDSLDTFFSFPDSSNYYYYESQRSLQFASDTDVLGVQFAIYHIPVPNTKYNREKFSPAEYSAGLSQTCSTLSTLFPSNTVHALGDQQYITSLPSCENLQTPNAGIASTADFDALHYQELSALSEKHMCRRKFGTDKHDHRRITREISLVYLNRFEALCDVAETQPDYLTILLDTDFDASKWGDIETVIQQRMNDSTDHSITTSKYPKIAYRNWYGREPCQDWSGFPSAKTDFIAIRGKDCPLHRSLYQTWLEEHLEYGKTLMHGVAKGCPCYDDEKVFHYMGVENEGVLSMVAGDLEGERGEEIIKIFIDNHFVAVEEEGDVALESGNLDEVEYEVEEEDVVGEMEQNEVEVMIDEVVDEEDQVEEEMDVEQEIEVGPDAVETEQEVTVDPDMVEGYEFEEEALNINQGDTPN